MATYGLERIVMVTERLRDVRGRLEDLNDPYEGAIGGSMAVIVM